jgi:hypothetical protein
MPPKSQDSEKKPISFSIGKPKSTVSSAFNPFGSRTMERREGATTASPFQPQPVTRKRSPSPAPASEAVTSKRPPIAVSAARERIPSSEPFDRRRPSSVDSIDSATSDDVMKRMPKRFEQGFLDKHIQHFPSSIPLESHKGVLAEKAKQRSGVAASTVLGLTTPAAKNLHREAKKAEKQGAFSKFSEMTDLPVYASVSTGYPVSAGSAEPLHQPATDRMLMVKGNHGKVNHFQGIRGVPPKRK